MYPVEQLLEPGAAPPIGPRTQIRPPVGELIEHRQHRREIHAPAGRAPVQGGEVHLAGEHDHQLAVDHGPRRQRGDGVDDVRKGRS